MSKGILRNQKSKLLILLSEYRVGMKKSAASEYLFYWNGENPFNLRVTELELLKKMVLKVASELNVPYISVDVGETSNNEWKVIEIGDGQFSDIRNISPLKLWNHIIDRAVH